MKPVCLVIGAGAGIGGTVGARFAAGGYHSVLCRRSDEEGLNKLVAAIEGEGNSASGFMLNVVEEGSIENLVEQVEKNIGPIEVVIYNLGAQIGNKPLAETTHKAFELGWRMATFGVFRTAQAVMPLMEKRGKGTFLITSATAAMRGNGGQHSHAAAMAGKRMLSQSLTAEFAPKNIHVVHIIIDGSVDAPDTLGKLLGDELFQKMKDSMGEDGVLEPQAVAETYWHLAHQHRSAWTQEIDLRPYAEKPWWSS